MLQRLSVQLVDASLTHNCDPADVDYTTLILTCGFLFHVLYPVAVWRGMPDAWQVDLNKYNYDELKAAANRRQMYSVHRRFAPVNATHQELKAFIIDTGNLGISHQADIA